VPFGVFTDPEIARIGLNEKGARALGIAWDLSATSHHRRPPRGLIPAAKIPRGP